jgi:hypothetical protein
MIEHQLSIKMFILHSTYLLNMKNKVALREILIKFVTSKLKLRFSEKATEFEEINLFVSHYLVTSKKEGDFVELCGLFRIGM